MSRTRSLPSHVETIRVARGTQPIPRPISRDEPAPQVVVEKIIKVVVEPRIVQILVIPESPRLEAPAPSVSPGRARRITNAYQPVDAEPRKPLVIA